jgi:hypothetical protein
MTYRTPKRSEPERQNLARIACAGVTNAVGHTRKSSIRKLREARVLAADAERGFVSKRGSKSPALKKASKADR